MITPGQARAWAGHLVSRHGCEISGHELPAWLDLLHVLCHHARRFTDRGHTHASPR